MKSRLLAVVILVSLVTAAGASAVSAGPAWAPIGEAKIRPGVATVTGSGICTSNFVFNDQSGNMYLGQAAHCSSTAPDTELNGCTTASLPVGTPVKISGASKPGVMVYNSWRTMQERKEPNRNICLFNDFALVKVDPADHNRVNPTVPFWGGPTGVVPSSGHGARAFGYGIFLDRDRIFKPESLKGVSLGQTADGWSHVVELTPSGTSGDSGAGILDDQGRAFGVLSTLGLRSRLNGVGDLSRELDYMKATSPFKNIVLANGTEPFRDVPDVPPAVRGEPVALKPAGPPPNLLGELLTGLLAGLGG